MPIESWTAPDEAPDLAAHATAMIDAALVGTGLSREAYWAAVRKGYNTPYNDPPSRRPSDSVVIAQPVMAAEPAVEVLLAAEPLPVAAMATAVAARAA